MRDCCGDQRLDHFNLQLDVLQRGKSFEKEQVDGGEAEEDGDAEDSRRQSQKRQGERRRGMRSAKQCPLKGAHRVDMISFFVRIRIKINLEILVCGCEVLDSGRLWKTVAPMDAPESQMKGCCNNKYNATFRRPSLKTHM